MPLQSVLRLFARTQHTIVNRPVKAYRPRLEQLEDRLAPATFTVLNTNAAGPGSLRAAILAADATNAADTIVFKAGLNGTINVSSAELTITKPLTITGPGAALLTLNGGGAQRIFNVADTGAFPTILVKISGLRLTNGASDQGAAIRNLGILSVSNCTFDNNSVVGFGGAVYNAGTCTIVACTFTSNTATGSAGQDGNVPGAGSGGGGAAGAGGAIFSESGTLTITNSTFTQNLAKGGKGGDASATQVSSVAGANGGGGISGGAGGVGSFGSPGSDFGGGGGGASSFPTGFAGGAGGNLGGGGGGGGGRTNGGAGGAGGDGSLGGGDGADGHSSGAGGGGGGAGLGGAIAIFNSSLTINGATFFNNTAIGGAGGHDSFGTPGNSGTGSAGAIFLVGAAVITNSTLSQNQATHHGGAILQISGTLNVTNSTIAGNSATSGAGIHSSGAAIITGSTFSGNSAIQRGGGIFISSGTVTLTNSTLALNSAESGGGIFNDEVLTLTNSTVTGNAASTLGGGIYNDDELTLTNSTIAGNSANYLGGGIYNDDELTLTNSTLSGNSANLDGGGIANGSNGKLTLTNSTIAGNSANYNGGGIFNFNELTVTNSTFSGNSAIQRGGGIFISSGTVTVTSSTLSGNSANISGGGIFNDSGTLTVTNSTLSGNSANHDGGGIYNDDVLTLTNSTLSGNSANISGGGIFINSGTVTVTNSTLTRNRADADGNGAGTGGGEYCGPSFQTLHNTLIAGNLRGSGAGTPDDINGGPINDPSNNLIGHPASAGGLVHGVDGNILGNGAGHLLPLALILDPILRNNGGPTQTHALIPGSPAIGAGNGANALHPGPNGVIGGGDDFLLPFDQRGPGFARLVGSTVDIGAYEMPIALFTDGFDRPDPALGAPWIIRAGAPGIVAGQFQGTGTTAAHVATILGAVAADVDLHANINLQVNQSAGLVARYNGSGDRSYYLGVIQKDAAGNTFAKILKKVNGVFTELAVVEGAGAAGKLRFRVSGQTLQLFLDDTLLATVRDATFASGGFGVRTVGATTLDNFQAFPLSTGLDAFDAFTLPDNTALAAPWARVLGTFTVQGNQIQGLDPANLAIIEGPRQADVDVRASVSITGLNHHAGLVARYVNISNYYFARLIRTSTGFTASLIRIASGRAATLRNVAIPSGTGKAELRFLATGTTLRVFVNGALVIDVADTRLVSGVAGIRSDAFAKLDDFRVATVTTALPFLDNFNQAEESELGINWTRRAGNFKIAGNQAVGVLARPSLNLATLVGVNVPDVAVQADINLVTTGHEAGLLAAYVSNSNYYLARVLKTATGHTLSIQRMAAGRLTTLGSVAVVGALTGPIRLQVLGTSLKLFMNNVEMLSRVDGALRSGSVGIRSVGTGTIDNFSATELAFLPFSDNFDADTLNPNWVRRAGGYTTTDPAAPNVAIGTAAFNLLTLGRLTATDVDIQANVSVLEKHGEHASLVARYSGPGNNNYYFAQLARIGTNNVIRIIKVVGGVTTTLASGNVGGLTGVLRFRVVGANLTLFFGGAELNAIDFSLTTGSIGIRGSLDSTFDDFQS